MRPISGFTTFSSFSFIFVFVQTLKAVKSQYLDSELLDELGTPRLFDEYLSFQAGNITINLVPWVFYTFLAFVLGKWLFSIFIKGFHSKQSMKYSLANFFKLILVGNTDEEGKCKSNKLTYSDPKLNSSSTKPNLNIF